VFEADYLTVTIISILISILGFFLSLMVRRLTNKVDNIQENIVVFSVKFGEFGVRIDESYRKIEECKREKEYTRGEINKLEETINRSIIASIKRSRDIEDRVLIIETINSNTNKEESNKKLN